MDGDAQRKQLELDSQRFGIPIEQLLEAVDADDTEASGDFPVWADNSETVSVFLACSKQWRWMAGFGGAMITGMDYTAVEAAMRMMGIKKKQRRDIFEGIGIMEQAAMEVANG